MIKLAYLSLGSNMGERRVSLERALDRLADFGTVAAVSSFYETAPVEFARQPDFLNLAVGLQTERMPRQLLHALLEIERLMGRKRTHANARGPRPLDIDFLLFGSAVIDTPELVIPHPRMHQRRFVLEPLAEIAPDVLHPVLKRTVRELRDALPPGGDWVRRLAE